MCGCKAADKPGFPQDIEAHAVKISENFHEDPIVAASFT
jgi:hypothetical protein